MEVTRGTRLSNVQDPCEIGSNQQVLHPRRRNHFSSFEFFRLALFCHPLERHLHYLAGFTPHAQG